jgi:hypothetical protein
VTAEEIRGAVLRHLDWIERLGCHPDDVDAFLGLPAGATAKVMAETKREG